MSYYPDYVLNELRTEYLELEGRVAYQVALHEQPDSAQLRIGENFFPSALTAPELRQLILNVTSYKDLTSNPIYQLVAQDTDVVFHPMDAGLGTSIERERYIELMQQYGIVRTFLDGVIGTKSQDLCVGTSWWDIATRHPQFQSIADLKIERLIKEMMFYHSLDLDVQVSSVSEGPMKMVYEKYEDDLQDQDIPVSFTREHRLPQYNVDTDTYDLETLSTGGHGYAGRIILDQIRNLKTVGNGRIHAIYNADGPNNGVSPEMVGFAKHSKAAFTMITTTRTKADKKGGTIGIKQLEDGTMVPAIMELKQAQVSEQQELFERVGLDEDLGIGLDHYPGQQYFNTNTVLMNEDVLHTFLNRIYDELGADAYNAIVAPEAMKTNKIVNGSKYQFTEGALGSLVLRLNEQVISNPQLQSMWEEISGNSQFLQIINLDPEDRDEYFTPIKYSIDHYLYSPLTNHYMLDPYSSKLLNNKPGKIPAFNGDLTRTATFYADVQNIIDAFGVSSMIGLNELSIEGACICPGIDWRGTVRIVIQNGDGKPHVLDQVYLKKILKQENSHPLILENIEIVVDENGDYTVKPLSPTS